MTAAVRILDEADRAALEAFLAAHADTSMFLRANLRAAGLVDQGALYEATYAAALDGAGRVLAAAGHCWNGMLLLEAPAHIAAVARAAVRPGRGVGGLLGPWAQVTAARAALGLASAPAVLDSREDLFALRLADLAVPPALAEGRLACRRATPADRAELTRWRADYRAEALHESDGPALRAASARDVDAQTAAGDLWVLEEAGRLVATSAFNATLPDRVQVGGVYTPPAGRGRGLARAVVAGSLAAARGAGVPRAVLFTGEDNRAARRAYEAIGFRRVGDYGIVILAEGAGH